MPLHRMEHPGLIFPDSPLHPANNPSKGRKTLAAQKFHRRGTDSHIPLDWGITTNQVARKMKISDSAARQLLHRHSIRNKVVRHPLRNTLQLFWNKKDVETLLRCRPGRTPRIPEGYMTTQEAATLLSLSKTSLARLHKRIKFPTKLIKLKQRKSERVHRIYKRDALIELLRNTRAAGFTVTPCFEHQQP